MVLHEAKDDTVLNSSLIGEGKRVNSFSIRFGGARTCFPALQFPACLTQRERHEGGLHGIENQNQNTLFSHEFSVKYLLSWCFSKRTKLLRSLGYTYEYVTAPVRHALQQVQYRERGHIQCVGPCLRERRSVQRWLCSQSSRSEASGACCGFDDVGRHTSAKTHNDRLPGFVDAPARRFWQQSFCDNFDPPMCMTKRTA